MGEVTLEVSRIRRPLAARLAARLELEESDTLSAVDHLVRAEQAGKASHGLIRLAYVTTSGKFGPYHGVPTPAPRRIAAGRLHVDGKNHFGYALLPHIVEAGCAEAVAHGSCVVTGTPVYPSGALGDWARLAAERRVGLLMFANSPRRVAPPGGRIPVVGTNAFCIGLPTDPLPFVADCATSAIPHGVLLVARANGTDLPPHSAVDAQGRETQVAGDVDPTKGLGALLPFGGSYKAFALAMGIELLAGLAGGFPGEIEAGRHGVFCTFLGPDILTQRIGPLSAWLRALDGEQVRIPGWVSGRRAAEQQRRGVVEVSQKTLDSLAAAEMLPDDLRFDQLTTRNGDPR